MFNFKSNKQDNNQTDAPADPANNGQAAADGGLPPVSTDQTANAMPPAPGQTPAVPDPNITPPPPNPITIPTPTPTDTPTPEPTLPGETPTTPEPANPSPTPMPTLSPTPTTENNPEGEQIMTDISSLQEDFNARFNSLAEKVRGFINSTVKSSGQTTPAATMPEVPDMGIPQQTPATTPAEGTGPNLPPNDNPQATDATNAAPIATDSNITDGPGDNSLI
jgi:hypothetical protein